MDWVKDKTRIEEEASFPYATTRQELIYELEEATTSKKSRKEQNKVREYLIETSFRVQIEYSGQWDSWVVDHERNLKIIVGAQGIPFPYVIRENDATDQTERDTWE